MMNFNSQLDDFSSRCRLFPLPDVVLFPHALLPLHIFEPRYRQMTEDALAGDRLVTMVQIRPFVKGSPWVEPVPIMDVGCLGEIIQHERLADGRFHFLLLGCKRVRLKREIPSAKLYRIAEAEIMEDENADGAFETCRHELIELFRHVFERRQKLDEGIAALLQSSVPLGVLSDIIAHALSLPALTKQALLAEPRVERRVETLRAILHNFIDNDESTTIFPPPFSAN
jgi:Lon protease-like protein